MVKGLGGSQEEICEFVGEDETLTGMKVTIEREITVEMLNIGT